MFTKYSVFNHKGSFFEGFRICFWHKDINCNFFFLIVIKTSMEVFSNFFQNHNFKRVNLAIVVIVKKFAYVCIFSVHIKDWMEIPDSGHRNWIFFYFFPVNIICFILPLFCRKQHKISKQKTRGHFKLNF